MFWGRSIGPVLTLMEADADFELKPWPEAPEDVKKCIESERKADVISKTPK